MHSLALQVSKLKSILTTLSVSFPAPPSEPRNINITMVTDSVVIVTWSRPKFDGGRTDLKYDLRCSTCSNNVCSGSCSEVYFWPSTVDLSTPQVTISNLNSAVLYNITVISKNGVSNQAGVSSLTYLHKTFSLTTSTPGSITTAPIAVGGTPSQENSTTAGGTCHSMIHFRRSHLHWQECLQMASCHLSIAIGCC